jgi:uncharacterized protein
MSYFVYKLTPPRPSFGPGDMTEAEAAIMGEHGAYWSHHLAAGVAVVFGPVTDPVGNWGLAVVEADDEADVVALRDNDPAVTSGLNTADILPMPVAFARRSDDSTMTSTPAKPTLSMG